MSGWVRFLDPGHLWWLAVAMPAILILYFLKLRRANQAVSSTLLWQTSIHDLRVNAPVQMIKRNLLLLLQLLIILLVLFAIARPFTRLRQTENHRTALILDVSASMATTDGDGNQTRLAAALAEAQRIVDSLGKTEGGSRHELCIILAADRPRTLCGLTSDKNRLRQALGSVTATQQSQTDMHAALQQALALTYVNRNYQLLQAGEEIESADRPKEGEEEYVGQGDRALRANVIVLSDGAFPPIAADIADKIAPPPASRFVRFGKTTSDNLAIVALDLRIASSESARNQLFVRLENMGDTPVRTAVAIDLNGEFLDRKRDILVPPRQHQAGGGGHRKDYPGQAGILFQMPNQASGVVKARIERKDTLALDNTASAILTAPKPIEALLVFKDTNAQRNSYYLEMALQVDKEHIRYQVMPASKYPKTGVPRTKDGGSYEILIFDRFSPARAPGGASFYVDAVPALPGIEQDEAYSHAFAPMVVDWKRAHPSMQNLSLLDHLRILRCRNLHLKGAWSTVMDGQGLLLDSVDDLSNAEKLQAAKEISVPLLGCYITESRRVALLAFDIWETERWPWRVSFPLFIRNTVHWLARPGGFRQAVALKTGEALRAHYGAPIESASVVLPDGSTRHPVINGEDRLYFSETHQTGIYRIRTRGQEDLVYAVNLLSSRESDNRSRDTIRFGHSVVSAEKGAAKSNVDLWPWVAGAALAFLLIEWYVYNKRILG